MVFHFYEILKLKRLHVINLVERQNDNEYLLELRKFELTFLVRASHISLLFTAPWTPRAVMRFFANSECCCIYLINSFFCNVDSGGIYFLSFFTPKTINFSISTFQNISQIFLKCAIIPNNIILIIKKSNSFLHSNKILNLTFYALWLR